MSGTAVVTSGTSTSDNKTYSAKRAGEIFYGKDTLGEIQSGETWSAADDKVATTSAIDARIIDLVDDVGGFVPIANETSFPTANPDVNNGAGTLVSIKAFASSHTPSGGSVTIANGAGSGNTVTITGCGSTVLAAGFGGIVETTSTLHTYTFHRLSPKATEVTTVAGNITNVNTVGGISGNVTTVAGISGNVTTVAGVSANVTTVAGVAANVTTVAGISANVTTVSGIASDVTAVAGKATEIGRLGTADAVADLNTLGTTAIVSDLDTCATNISNINNVGGSITNVNTVASNLASVNNFANQYRISSSQPSSSLDAGDLYFDTTANELRVYNGSSWQGGVTATGNLVSKADIGASSGVPGSGSNGQYLQTNGSGTLSWQTVSTTPEGTAILSTGESGGTKFLREDGDGSCSWQVTPATEGTAILSTGESATNKYLTTDGDGTSSWSTIDLSLYAPKSGAEFTGVVGLKGNSDQLKFYDDDDSHFVHLKSPSALAGNVTLTLPQSDGNSGEFLKTNGSGTLSWGAVSTVITETAQTISSSLSITIGTNAMSVSQVALASGVILTIPVNSTYIIIG